MLDNPQWELVTVKLDPELAEKYLGTQDKEKFLAETGWDDTPSIVTRVNVDWVGTFLTDISGVTADDGGLVEVGKKVHVTEPPCPMDSCNHWIRNVPGTVVHIGADNDAYWEAFSAEPAVNYYLWLQ